MNINLISNSITQANSSLQKELLAYYQQLEKDVNGWRFALNALTDSEQQLNETAIFFCFQLLESHIRFHYAQGTDADRLLVRQFLGGWFSLKADQPAFVSNKYAAIVTSIFLQDYPAGKWDSFFFDFMHNCNGERNCDLFLRVLAQINTELVDRELPRTIQECERNTTIKDKMRDTCLTELAQFWFNIISNYTSESLVRACLLVVSGYISWIDIVLITNESMMSSLFNLLSKPAIRCNVIDCFKSIFYKGMDPVTKVQFINQFLQIPCIQNYFERYLYEQDYEFIERFTSLFAMIGLQLVDCYKKLKPKSSVPTDNANISTQRIIELTQMLDSKFDVIIKMMSHPSHQVLLQLHPFAREYIQWVKISSALLKPDEAKSKINFATMMLIKVLLPPCKYTSDHDVDDSDDEDIMDEFRQSTKILVDNLMVLNADQCTEYACELIKPILEHQNLETLQFYDIEAPLYFLSLLGEHFNLISNKSALEQIIRLTLESPINQLSNPAIRVVYLELICRFDKLISTTLKDLVPQILITFLDERGFKNRSSHVRSRAISLFAKFVKSQLKLRNNTSFVEYAVEIINNLRLFINLDAIDTVQLKDIEDKGVINECDQHLFETISFLLFHSFSDGVNKVSQFKQFIIDPITNKYQQVLARAEALFTGQKLSNGFENQLGEEGNAHAKLYAYQIAHLISLLNHSSKAVTNPQIVKSLNMQHVFLKIFNEFAQSLSLPFSSEAFGIIQNALRHLLHRYIVFLNDSDIVPLLPNLIQNIFLPSACFTAQTIQELVPLLNQIVSKFKHSWLFQKDVYPFLCQLFTPFINYIFTLNNSTSIEDDEKIMLQKSYFIFLSIFANSNIFEIVMNLDATIFEQVLLSLIQGLQLNDQNAQKNSLLVIQNIFKFQIGLLQCDGDEAGINNNHVPMKISDSVKTMLAQESFIEHIYSTIIPSALDAYLKQADENSLSSELCSLLKNIMDYRGQDEFCMMFSRYLCTKYSFTEASCQELCQSLLATNIKAQRAMFKQLFQSIRKRQIN